jgi:hypothetical protein
VPIVTAVEDEQAVAQQQHQQSSDKQALPLTAAAVTAHAKAIAAAEASPDFVVSPPEKLQTVVPAALRETRKSTDQALMSPKHHQIVLPDMPNIKPLMAMSLNRPYTGTLRCITTSSSSSSQVTVHCVVRVPYRQLPAAATTAAVIKCFSLSDS